MRYQCGIPCTAQEPQGAAPLARRPVRHSSLRGSIDYDSPLSIFRPRQSGISDIFNLYGSVLPRCLGHAIFGALLGGLLEGLDAEVVQYQKDWLHPYSLHVFAVVLGFSLVMRIQIAYARLWEGATQCHQAASKWSDACMQVVAFDEASKDAFSDVALEFRMLYLHYASLMHACSLIDMRHDDFIVATLSLNREDPMLFRPTSTMAIVNGAEDRSNEPRQPKPSAANEYAGRSLRAHTVPLQMVLHTRKQLQLRSSEPINSFEAVDAMEMGIKPISYGSKKSAYDSQLSDSSRRPEARRPHPSASAKVSPSRSPPVVVRHHSGSPRPKLGNASCSSVVMRPNNAAVVRELTAANKFDVLGGVTAREIEILRRVKPGDRVFRVQTWMMRLMTNRLCHGGLAIPPPLLSRTYQVLSDGTAAANQARKIAYVEFPFALRQLLMVLLTVFTVLAPMCIGAFMDSVPLVVALSFFVCMGYVALNETARELEMPFGLQANDLNLTEYQTDFNTKLASLLDQTIPALGYLERVRSRSSQQDSPSPHSDEEVGPDRALQQGAPPVRLSLDDPPRRGSGADTRDELAASVTVTRRNLSSSTASDRGASPVPST